ncbi:DUF4872 domain-containing protein [Nonomuraea sp. LPB2021202275-12-8]|uniref:DUF4872 domain-containing protein n=1 Tax=Nonomuraea sp. LPB2021202275-12-8 TaxID=3120159 RepID=UPI00300CDAC0
MRDCGRCGPAPDLLTARPRRCRAGHEVAVAGIEGDTVYLDDQFDQPYEMPLELFMAAWSGVRKDRHHLVSITGSAHADLGRAASEAVAGTVAKLTGPVLGNNFDVNFGLSGMRRLAAQLADTTTKTGWARRFADPEAFFIGMTRLHDCLEIEYGAPGAMRPLYAGFLDEAGGRQAAAEVYREAGSAWSAVARAALPAHVPQLARYRELVSEREELKLTDRAAGAVRIQRLDAEAAKLPGEYGAADQLGTDGRMALLAELGALVEQAVRLEERGVELLRRTA